MDVYGVRFDDSGPLTRSVLQLALALRTTIAGALEELGLGHTKYLALAMLEAGSILRAAELARLCGVRRQTMHRMLAQLEADGLVERRAPDGDARTLVPTITPWGRRLLGRARTAVAEIDRDLLTALQGFGLSVEEGPWFAGLLEGAAERMSWDADQPTPAARRRSSAWMGAGPARTSPDR